MTKVVYNNCFGGFGLSDEALERYKELKGIGLDERVYVYDIDRTDTCLVQVVEELGTKASDILSDLRIEDIPKGTRYRIDEYDGSETVETVDTYDWSLA